MPYQLFSKFRTPYALSTFVIQNEDNRGNYCEN